MGRQKKQYRPADRRVTPEQPMERPPEALEGIVVRAYGKYFDVALDDDDRVLLSTPKGTLKRAAKTTDLIAVGDRVWVVDVGEGEGRVEAVLPRTRVLARRARNTRDVEQIVLANPDQAVIMLALTRPEPHLRLLDRFLIMCEAQGIPAVIAINKIDLAGGIEVRTRRNPGAAGRLHPDLSGRADVGVR
jgi:ribosome biogenesis GTPase